MKSAMKKRALDMQRKAIEELKKDFTTKTGVPIPEKKKEPKKYGAGGYGR